MEPTSLRSWKGLTQEQIQQRIKDLEKSLFPKRDEQIIQYKIEQFAKELVVHGVDAKVAAEKAKELYAELEKYEK